MSILNYHKFIRILFDPRKTSFLRLLFSYMEITTACFEIRNTFDLLNNNNTQIDVIVNNKYFLRSNFRNLLLRRSASFLSFLFNRDNNVDVFILGSQLVGSNHAVGFSDYDIVFGLKNNRLSICNTIYIHLINRICYSICPFQHHSSFFIFETQHNKYCSPFLPLGAFVEILSLTSNLTKSILINNPYEYSYSKERFQNARSRIKSTLNNSSPNMPANKLQHLLALTLLLPTLELQSRGFRIGKKESFFSSDLLNRQKILPLESARTDCFEIYNKDYLFLFLPIFIFPRFSIIFYYLESVFPFSKSRNIKNRNYAYSSILGYIYD